MKKIQLCSWIKLLNDTPSKFLSWFLKMQTCIYHCSLQSVRVMSISPSIWLNNFRELIVMGNMRFINKFQQYFIRFNFSYLFFIQDNFKRKNMSLNPFKFQPITADYFRFSQSQQPGRFYTVGKNYTRHRHK